MRVYVAGPMSDLSFAEAAAMFMCRVDLLRSYGYEVFHPFTGHGEVELEGESGHSTGYAQPIYSDHAIFERDRWMVSQADIIYADFTNTAKISIGTVMELAWAHQLDKHAVVVMEPGNPHQHAFVLEAADVVFPTRDQANSYLARLIHSSL